MLGIKNKNRKAKFLLAFFVFILILQISPFNLFAQFYVATNGNDNWSGTLPSPNVGNTDGPFATLGKAMQAMRGSSTKTCYLRAGTYSNLPKVTLNSGFPTQAALMLISADNGETWSYYPPDGYNTAILDGGNTTTGNTSMCQNTLYSDYGVYIEGGSNITINGLTFENFTFGGVALHGGKSWFGNWFPTGNLGSGAADNNLIENNIMHDIHNGNPTTTGICTNPAWPPDISKDNTAGGGIAALGRVTNLVVSHNVIYNTEGPGVDMQLFSTTDDMSGLKISYNFVYNVNIKAHDQGCMHLYNYAQNPGQQGTLSGVTYTNNYLRDCGGSGSSSPYGSTRGIYVDDGVSNVTITGNVIAGHMAYCFNYHAGNNDTVKGNICDLGDGALNRQYIWMYQDAAFCNTAGCMANNVYENNIVIAKASIAMGGASTYISSGVNPLTAQNDLSHSYGTGSITDKASVSTADPLICGWEYRIASGSPVYNSPVNFPQQPIKWGQPGFWGPPGFVIPHTGTPPSCSLSCGISTGIAGTVNQNNNIWIYPNPFNANFTVNISKETVLKNTVIKIYDVCGKEVKTTPIGNHETIIDRDELSNGLYFYSIINNNEKIANGKLLIQ